MLPAICLALFGLCFLLLLLILIPIIGAAFKDKIKKAMDEKNTEKPEEQPVSYALSLIVAEIFIAICAGLWAFFPFLQQILLFVLSFQSNRFIPFHAFHSFISSNRVARLQCNVHFMAIDEKRPASQ